MRANVRQQRSRFVRGASEELRLAAKRLRREQTPAEKVLWEALRDRRLNGLRFRRQHPLGQLILDFYCPDHRLVIEVDGSVHSDPEQAARDISRNEHLAASGYTVIRFRNEEVLSNLQAVTEAITEKAKLLKERRSPHED